MNLAVAQEFLQTEFPDSTKMYFMDIPVENFEKEDLIRLVALTKRDYSELLEDKMRSNRMHRMFHELGSKQ